MARAACCGSSAQRIALATAARARPVSSAAFVRDTPPMVNTGRPLAVAAIQAVYKAGFDGFCSAYGAYNFPGQDSYHIRRVHGDPDFSRLRNWLTYDVRKAKHQRDIRYWMPPATNWETTKDLVG